MEVEILGVHTLPPPKRISFVSKTLHGIKALAQYAKFNFYIKILRSVVCM